MISSQAMDSSEYSSDPPAGLDTLIIRTVKFKMSNGDKYEGQAIGDVRHGRGKHLCVNGDNYDGNSIRSLDTVPSPATHSVIIRIACVHIELCNGAPAQLPQTQKLYCYCGAYISGEWKLGTRYGHGIMTFASGLVYEGTWVEDKACGDGVCTYPNSDKYSGEWMDDKRWAAW